MADSVDPGSGPRKPDPSDPLSHAVPFTLEQLEEAIASTFQRGALSTSARLSLRLSQSLYYTATPSFAKALEYARFAHEAAQECISDHQVQDLTFDLELRLLLGKLFFFREEYQQAEEHLKVVLQLASTSPGESRLTGDAAWMLAGVQRARRDPHGALAHCWAALRAYESVNAPNPRARLSIIVADSALDVLEQRGAPQHYVDIASSHISRAITLAAESGDPSTLGMADLARARFARIVDRSGQGLWIIENVLRDAARQHDRGLLTQAYSALGFELLARDLAPAASNSFYDALVASKDSEALALSGPARRILLLRKEFGIH
jgi:tetratricopeptide (TPR) repeat protein